ncbi:MAG: hypothetical protein PSV35_02835, partial [bacterium]|nr:hypothetical protein [bacterium]
NCSNNTAAINNAFNNFLEQKANIKYGALLQSGFPINLNEQEIQNMGWTPINIETERKKIEDAALLVYSKISKIGGKLERIRAEIKAKKDIGDVVVEATKLAAKDLVGQHEVQNTQTYVPPTVEFLKHGKTTVIDGNSLKFLRENPAPTLKETKTKQDCDNYFKEVASHLQKLKTFTGLENKLQRINEFCNSATTSIFNLPYSPPSELVNELTQSLLDDYKSDKKDASLKFLRENPAPTLKETKTKQDCDNYFKEVASHLQKLKTFTGFENKLKQIKEFYDSATLSIFNLPYPPPPELVNELTQSLLDDYKSDKKYASFNEAFMHLENAERAQLLTNLIKLNLSQIDVTSDPSVNSQFLSTIKQWEKLISPRDEVMSAKINKLTPNGTRPSDADMIILEDVEVALHASPVGLEGLYEGQHGIQVALTVFKPNEDSALRKEADRLGMRNGDAILAQKFITYYSNKAFLLSSDGINSTQGREFFNRACLDAFRNATIEDKSQLLDFLKNLPLDQKRNPCLLKAPHEVFVTELFAQCANSDPKIYKELTKEEFPGTRVFDSFIDSCTTENSSSFKQPDGTDRLFGFAKDVNMLALKIEHLQKQDPTNQVELDKIYAKLICANLAYQLTYDQINPDILANLNKNFEFAREMSLVEVNLSTLQSGMTQFSSKLGSEEAGALFKKTYLDYAKQGKFDIQVNLGTPKPIKDLPGFISLEDRMSLDVLHGAIYLGANKLSVMPAFIQSNIALQELGIKHFPFKPKDGEYIYAEDGKVKASITPQQDGSLVIQRELKTLDDTSQVLQYIEPDKLGSIPISLQRRLNAVHYFADSNGTIHGFSSDFTPKLTLSKGNDGTWQGVFIDHRDEKISVNLDTAAKSMTEDLKNVFPSDEMIRVNEHVVYIPAISKYVLYDSQSKEYFLSDSNLIQGAGVKQHLTIAANGTAYTTKVLSDSEQLEIEALNLEIKELTQESPKLTEELSTLREHVIQQKIKLKGITLGDSSSTQAKEQLIKQLQDNQLRIKLLEGTSLLNKQEKVNVTNNIKEKENKIKEIITPEYFIFVAKSPQIVALEEQVALLKTRMDDSYVQFKAGNKDKKTLASHYDLAKKDYFTAKEALNHAYASVDYLRSYKDTDGSLHPKDFQSIMHMGNIEGKAAVLTQLLGVNIPQAPLKPSELDQLHNVKHSLENKNKGKVLTSEDGFALIMLIGVELQHHILERAACSHGKLEQWNEVAYHDLLGEFVSAVKAIKPPQTIPVEPFSELWRAIQSDVPDNDGTLARLFIKPVTAVATGEAKPISLNTKTTNMPIESIDARSLVQVNLFADLKDQIDNAQEELERRLKEGLTDFSESVQDQEAGYYYENYGVFNE